MPKSQIHTAPLRPQEATMPTSRKMRLGPWAIAGNWETAPTRISGIFTWLQQNRPHAQNRPYLPRIASDHA